METAILRKRLNTFKSAKGTLRKVSNEVVLEVLRGWEGWTGKTSEYYREIGLSRMQMVTMIQKGKKLVKSGALTESEFRELSVPVSDGLSSIGASVGMELKLDASRAIRFSQVDQLVEFLKKTS
jgi:hypothetical protein